MIERVTYVKRSSGRTEHVRTVSCPLCGAVRGADFSSFSRHLERDHGPEDISHE